MALFYLLRLSVVRPLTVVSEAQATLLTKSRFLEEKKLLLKRAVYTQDITRPTVVTVTALFQLALLLCSRESRANEANFCSGKASTLHADPRDCSKFYSCMGATTFSFPCPPGLLFNDIVKVCDWPDNVKCTTGTTARAVEAVSASPIPGTKTTDNIPPSTVHSVITTPTSQPVVSIASSPMNSTAKADSITIRTTVSPTLSTMSSQIVNFTKTTISDRALTTATSSTTTLATDAKTTLTPASTWPTTLTTSSTMRTTALTTASKTGATTLTSTTTTGDITLTSAATTRAATLSSVTTTIATTLASVATTIAAIVTTAATSAATTLTQTTATRTKSEQSIDERVLSPSSVYCEDRKDGLYEDPEDCSGFYQCHRGYTYHFQCLRGLVFNQQHQYCDWPFNVDCVKRQRVPVAPDSTPTAGTTLSTTTRSTGSSSTPGCNRIVCYVSNWSKYRFGKGRFTVGDIDPKLCSHIIYSFVKLSGNTLVPIDPADEPSEADVGDFARVTRLKALNPKLKVLLALGGWTSSSADFSRMASSPESREEFVNTAVRFLRERNFDGLDFDWEYPANEDEKELFALLCEKLRNAFDSEADGNNRLLLTVAVSAGKWSVDAAYDVPRISTSVDFINLMSYDLHGPWDGRTGHHSPLYAGSWEQGDEGRLNVDWVANYWASKGAPKHKLVVGAPLYARTYTLADKGAAGVGSPILSGGSAGPYTNEAGYLSYYEVCLRRAGQQQQTWHTIESQKVPFMVTGNQWIGYDDTVSLREKVRYIRHNGYGGVMVWELSQDDFNGQFCQEGRFPLLTSINNECFI